MKFEMFFVYCKPGSEQDLSLMVSSHVPVLLTLGRGY